METELFNAIVETFQDMGATPRSYSGRGMYGKECFGVDSSNPVNDLIRLFGALAEQFDAEQIAEVANALDGVRMDSMGRGSIMYWPSIEWQENVRDDQDEDGDDAPYLGAHE